MEKVVDIIKKVEIIEISTITVGILSLLVFFLLTRIGIGNAYIICAVALIVLVFTFDRYFQFCFCASSAISLLGLTLATIIGHNVSLFSYQNQIVAITASIIIVFGLLVGFAAYSDGIDDCSIESNNCCWSRIQKNFFFQLLGTLFAGIGIMLC